MNAPAPTLRHRFARRLGRYLLERFPPLGHGLLVIAFTFSAIAYSRLCVGAEDFIPAARFAAACVITLGCFLLLRIADEHKDAAEDRLARPHLPVPRGLVSLRELRRVAGAILAGQLLALCLVDVGLLPLYALTLGYLGLMTAEFGVPGWLRARPWAYAASHMLVIPLVDVLASGFDWRVADEAPPLGLAWFFAVSYGNGFVLELGRKFAPPGTPDPARRAYTTQLGPRGAALAFAVALVATLALAVGAARAADHGPLATGALGLLAVPCVVALLAYLRRPDTPACKRLELVSGLWALGMYLLLGGLPMLTQLITS